MGFDVSAVGGASSIGLLPDLDSTGLQAERMIRENSTLGVVDVAALARATYDPYHSEMNDADALRDAIAERLDDRDRQAYLLAGRTTHHSYDAPIDGAAYLAAQPSPVPEFAGQAPAAAERVPLGQPSFTKPDFKELPPAANDNEPGRIPLNLFSRFGVLTLPLLLSGDTPQPRIDARLVPGTTDLAVVQVRSGVTDQVQDTYFAKVEQKPTPLLTVLGYPIGPTVGTEPTLIRMDVPVTLENGEIRYDPAALAQAYGRAVPGWTDEARAPVASPSGPLQPGEALPLDSEERAWAAALKAAGAQPEQIAAEIENIRAERRASTNRSDPRNQPGTAHTSGPLTTIEGEWLRGTQGNAGLFPAQVAAKLEGRQFRNFAEFREAFWKAVADTPSLASQFSPRNQASMRDGNAPIAVKEQWFGGSRSYALHHVTPIAKGGGVYDMNNLVILTPRMHQEILWKRYHFGQQ